MAKRHETMYMYLLNTLYGMFEDTEKRRTKRHETMYLLHTSYCTGGEMEEQTDEET